MTVNFFSLTRHPSSYPNSAKNFKKTICITAISRLSRTYSSLVNAGNHLDYYNALDEKSAFDEIEYKLTHQTVQHLLIINPNNPSTLSFTPQQLSSWAQKLGKGAYLIVDEAFIDSSPAQSLLPYLSNTPLSVTPLSKKPTNNIIVLRSFGKFFGLAGILLRLIDISEDKSILRIGRIKAKDSFAQDRIRSVFSNLITTQQSAR
jgi:bifunctional pyridoxal-dependent enzyme with beta-cystathionase and maltose regulon repressor activities